MSWGAFTFYLDEDDRNPTLEEEDEMEVERLIDLAEEELIIGSAGALE